MTAKGSYVDKNVSKGCEPRESVFSTVKPDFPKIINHWWNHAIHDYAKDGGPRAV